MIEEAEPKYMSSSFTREVNVPPQARSLEINNTPVFSDNPLNDSISEQPNFSECHEEELRSRLYLIRQALQKEASDKTVLDIQNVFTNSAFKTFFRVVDFCQSSNTVHEKMIVD